MKTFLRQLRELNLKDEEKKKTNYLDFLPNVLWEIIYEYIDSQILEIKS
jgi:hypothetical protein